MVTDEDIYLDWCELCDQVILPSQETTVVDGDVAIERTVVHRECYESLKPSGRSQG
jgi:hypothetical protein